MYISNPAVSKMFSELNSAFASLGPIDALRHLPRFKTEVPCGPGKLVRSTNEFYHYFGYFPSNCASITTRSQIERLGVRGLTVKRHVVQLPVNMDMAKQDVVRKINQLVGQLEAFSEFLVWKKKKNIISVTFLRNGEPTGEFMMLECYVCDDTGLFHVLVAKECLWKNLTCFDPVMDSDNMNKLIFSIRRVYEDKDNFTEMPELNKEAWEAQYPLTREQTTEFVHFEPDWLHDDVNDWKFDDIEANVPPLHLGDILERMPFPERALSERQKEVLMSVTCVQGVQNMRWAPEVFEVEECEEPPYKKRKVEKDLP